MPPVIPKQPKKEREQITIRLDRDVLQTLEHYCRYLNLGAITSSTSVSLSSFAKTSHSAYGFPVRESRVCVRSTAVR